MIAPALVAWRRELAAGQRTRLTFDPLWRAACAEALALEMNADGFPGIAKSYLLDAQAIIRAARKAA